MPTGYYIRKRFFNPEQEQDIINRYTELKQGTKEIGKDLGFSQTAIHNCLKRNNIPRRSAADAKREYSVNESYFDEIDSPDKAYWLGWLWTDGTIATSKRTIQINLHEKDKRILETLNSLIGNERPLRLKKYEGILVEFPDGVMGYRGNQVFLTIHSRRIWERVQQLGCPPHKSLIIDFPEWMPDNLFFHFLRAVNDGDGGFGKSDKPYMSISGSENFIKNLQQRLTEITGIRSGVNKGDGVWVLRISRLADIVYLIDRMYSDSGECKLDRKYQRAMLIKDRYNLWSDKEKSYKNRLPTYRTDR